MADNEAKAKKEKAEKGELSFKEMATRNVASARKNTTSRVRKVAEFTLLSSSSAGIA